MYAERANYREAQYGPPRTTSTSGRLFFLCCVAQLTSERACVRLRGHLRSRNGRLLCRGGGRKRWHSLVNCGPRRLNNHYGQSAAITQPALMKPS
eukprot:SAG25_NODE_21_length_22373_cov_13.904373_10_plen_95_part_00